MVGEIRVGEAETAYEMNANPPPRPHCAVARVARFVVGTRLVNDMFRALATRRRATVA